MNRLVLTLILVFVFVSIGFAQPVRDSATCAQLNGLAQSDATLIGGHRASEWFALGYAAAYLSTVESNHSVTVGEFEGALVNRCMSRPSDTLYDVGRWILGLS